MEKKKIGIREFLPQFDNLVASYAPRNLAKKVVTPEIALTGHIIYSES